MKRRGHLNQALEEYFVRVRRLQPYFLPMLVGVVEVGGIKRFKSFLIKPIFFVRIHACFWTLRHIHRRVRHHSRGLKPSPASTKGPPFLMDRIVHLNFSLRPHPRYHG